MDISATSLDELRRRIDTLDDRLHDLLMERAELVAGVAAVKQSTGVPSLRPGREAQILRRVAGRHRGPFPRQSLVRMWRELLGGMVAMQGRFSVAVTVPTAQPGLWDLARDHFGGHLGMLALGSPDEVLGAIGDGSAAVGVLPLPQDREPAPWWPALVRAQPGPPTRVLARLPFGGRGNARPPGGDALVVGRAELDPSGDDQSLVVIATRADRSRGDLLAALDATGRRATYLAGFAPAQDEIWHLAEIDGPVAPEEASFTASLKSQGLETMKVSLLGLYARPLPPEPQ
jgi:chorismate mutase-like protein